MFKSRKSLIIKKSLRNAQLLKSQPLRIQTATQTKKQRQGNSEKIISATTIQNTTEHGAWDTSKNNLVYETELIRDAEYEKALEIINTGQKDSFSIFNISSVKERVDLWRKLLPMVEPFYAIKSNPDEGILRECLKSGTNFDCASMGEIQIMLRLGAKPNQIIFAHPCKQEPDILFAKQVGVKLMTFDCVEEVEKIHELFPQAELVCRIGVEFTDAPCPMSCKFGASLNSYEEIVEICKKLNMRLRGVSFHVGTGGCSFEVYKNTILNAKNFFQIVKSKKLPDCDLLDIGGGFSMSATSQEKNFDQIAPKLADFFTNIFPGKENQKVKIIAEPGRLFCQQVHSTCVRVFLTRQTPDSRHMFVNSGVYQQFGAHIFDKEFFKGQPILNQEEAKKRIAQHVKTYIWGQTCDGVDYFIKGQLFPIMNRDEWLIYRNMGAYNSCIGIDFNGYPQPKKYYL